MYKDYLHLIEIKNNICDEFYDMIENDFIVKYFKGNCDKYNKFNSSVYKLDLTEKEYIEWVYYVIMNIDVSEVE